MLIIDWKPDKTLRKPLYKQIVIYIKERISLGEWSVGTKLPTQRELAKVFEVNRSTVIEALEELKSEGLIEGKRSGGTVIINNTWSLLAANPPPNWQHYINSGIHKPNQPTIRMINQLEFKKEIIRLGTGELSPELYPKDLMKKVLLKISDQMDSLGYEEPRGSFHLRKTISTYMEKFGIITSPASVLVVSGSLQALQLISIGMLNPGSTILVEKPSYLKSLYIFQSTGMRLKGISMDHHGIKVNELKNLERNRNNLLYTIPSFHNPTSITMPYERRCEILKVCDKYRIPIIEDDVYRELWLDEPPPVPFKAMDKNGTVLYMGSVSKSLAPGLRIGWLIGPEPVIERLGDIKMQTDYGSSSLSQRALSEFISSGLYEKYLRDLREKLTSRRQLALSILEQYYSDIGEWKKPRGGFYIWLKLKRPISMEKLFSLASADGILINPGNIYDFSNNQNIRISYSYASLIDLRDGLKRLAQIIRKCDNN